MKSISSSIISLVHVTVFFLHFEVSSFPAIFAQVNTCSCYYLHSQIYADKDSVFWLVNLHPSSIQVERKIGCISIPSKSVQVFWFKFLVWYTRSKNLNSRNLNGDLDAKLVSCIPGFSFKKNHHNVKNNMWKTYFFPVEILSVGKNLILNFMLR
jgi:hypothetical protein